MNANDPRIEFLPAKGPVQRINPAIRQRLVATQQSVITRAFTDGRSFCTRIADDLKVAVPIPAKLKGKPVTVVSDLAFAELREFWLRLVSKAGIPESAAGIHAINLSQHTQLLRAFDDPESALSWATSKVVEIVGNLPKSARDIEIGRNRGDVLDPYILAATQILLHGNDFRQAIGSAVAHKALMILEDLMGHLHEELVGRMRGNLKMPEPRGDLKELLDPFDNPFPGADVVQPPSGPAM